MTGVLGWVLVLVTGVIKSEQLGWGKYQVCKELTVLKTVANLVETPYHRRSRNWNRNRTICCCDLGCWAGLGRGGLEPDWSWATTSKPGPNIITTTPLR